MQLNRWEAQLLCYFCVLDLASLLKSHSSDTFCHVAAGSNGRTAAKSLELDIDDLAGFLVHLDLKLHNITACRCSNKASSNVFFVLGK